MKFILFTTALIGLVAGSGGVLAQPLAGAGAAPLPQPPVSPTLATPAASLNGASAARVETAAAVAPTCEMHIWPAARVAATTQGAGSWFGLIGAAIDAASHADQNKRDKAFITSALDPAAQARALKELDLPRTLNLPPAKVITHDQGIELTGEVTGRLARSSAPCYYDVVVRQLFYLKTATTKGKMRTFIAVRGSDGNKRVIDYKDSANHALDVTLPKEGEDATPASRALIDAFKADVGEFSEKFVRKTAMKS
jgi:hypothetical protein